MFLRIAVGTAADIDGAYIAGIAAISLPQPTLERVPVEAVTGSVLVDRRTDCAVAVRPEDFSADGTGYESRAQKGEQQRMPGFQDGGKN